MSWFVSPLVVALVYASVGRCASVVGECCGGYGAVGMVVLWKDVLMLQSEDIYRMLVVTPQGLLSKVRGLRMLSIKLESLHLPQMTTRRASQPGTVLFFFCILACCQFSTATLAPHVSGLSLLHGRFDARSVRVNSGSLL